jgi:hypothetical protein
MGRRKRDQKMSAQQILIPLAWSAFILWTVYKFWRSPQDTSRQKYIAGAKFFGICMTIFAMAIAPSIIVFPRVPYWAESAVLEAVTFPISLWLGLMVASAFQTK